MSKEKALDLAKRLHALATRGVDGEAVNAQAALDRLLAKHGLTLDDIIGEERTLVRWSHRDPTQNYLRMGIYFKVMGTHERAVQHVDVFEHHRTLSAFLTVAERVEMEEHFSVLWPHMQAEHEIFEIAFARAHSLHTLRTAEETQAMLDSRTEEEQRCSERASNMAMNIDRRAVHRQLNDAGS